MNADTRRRERRLPRRFPQHAEHHKQDDDGNGRREPPDTPSEPPIGAYTCVHMGGGHT
jgi:hypothetical protein